MKEFNLEGHSKSYESILATYENAKKKLEEQNKKDKEALKKRYDYQYKMLGKTMADIQPLTLNLEKEDAEIVIRVMLATKEFADAYNRINAEYQKKKEQEQAEKVSIRANEDESKDYEEDEDKAEL